MFKVDFLKVWYEINERIRRKCAAYRVEWVDSRSGVEHVCASKSKVWIVAEVVVVEYGIRRLTHVVRFPSWPVLPHAMDAQRRV